MKTEKKMSSEEKLKQMVPEDENILYSGAPARKPFYVERIVEEMAIPFAWMLITFYILSIYAGFDIPIISVGALIIIMIVANLPMIIWLCRTLMAGTALKNTYYIITDKAMYFKNGANEFEVFKTEEERFEYKDIIRVRNHYGVVDRLFNVGDIYVELMRRGKKRTFYIIDVECPVALLNVIKKAKEAAINE